MTKLFTSHLLRQAWTLAKQAATAEVSSRRLFGWALKEIRKVNSIPSIEDVRKTLIGRTVDTDYVTLHITGVRRWTSEDGRRIRDYIDLEQSKALRSGPAKIRIVRKGDDQYGVQVQTSHGLVAYEYGPFCSSGAKKVTAREAVEKLFA